MEKTVVYNRIFNKEDFEKLNPKNKAIINDFLLEMKSQKKAKSTLEQYGYDCRFFLTWNYKYNEDKNVLDLRKRDFRNFFLWCDENQMSGARRNRILSVIHLHHFLKIQ